jgi:hypothetical protein
VIILIVCGRFYRLTCTGLPPSWLSRSMARRADAAFSSCDECAPCQK